MSGSLAVSLPQLMENKAKPKLRIRKLIVDFIKNNILNIKKYWLLKN
jgi:hypothetical protein